MRKQCCLSAGDRCAASIENSLSQNSSSLFLQNSRPGETATRSIRPRSSADFTDLPKIVCPAGGEDECSCDDQETCDREPREWTQIDKQVVVRTFSMTEHRVNEAKETTDLRRMALRSRREEITPAFCQGDTCSTTESRDHSRTAFHWPGFQLTAGFAPVDQTNRPAHSSGRHGGACLLLLANHSC